MRFCEAPEGCSYPVFSSDKITRKGYCKYHANKYRTDLDRRTIVQRAMAKQNGVNAKVRSLNTEDNQEGIKKQIWFSERRKEMSGWCSCGCGNQSSKDDDKNFRSSACHILPQRHFKSVRWHPLNWVELAFFGGCHTNMDDRGSMEWDKMKCWPEIVRRFKVLYPLTYTYERQFIPKILQQFIPELITL